MQENQLSKGISILYDMELNNYLMTRGIQTLNSRISSLGRARTYKSPSKKSFDFFNIEDWCFPLIMFWPGVIIGAVSGVISGFLGYGVDFWERLWDAICNLFIYGFWGAIIGVAIGIAASIIAMIIRYYRAKKEYEEAVETCSSNTSLDRQRVSNEVSQKTILIRQRDELIKRKQDAEQKLKKFYSAVGIDKDYQNLICMGYMTEFTRLGIATKLGGADGLYMLIRRELQINQINATLEDISYKLDTIIDNQHRVYTEIQSMNRKCDTMIATAENQVAQLVQQSQKLDSSLNHLIANTSITAYNTGRIKTELEYHNYLQTWWK